jgi:hypothetical protein
MPYINPEQKKKLVVEYTKHNTMDLGIEFPDNPGELNYVITMLIKNYFNNKPCYQSINDIVGALEGAKLEFYRRVAAPYEDLKIKENGDVY